MNAVTPPQLARPVFNHKIGVPKAHKHAVQRQTLLAQLRGDQRARIVVLQGPAGHGKTSLMLQAEEECRLGGAITGWLSLDESDNDIRRLLGHFEDLLSVLGRQSTSTPTTEFEPEQGAFTSGSDWVLGQLLELGKPVAVFLDDLHTISNRAALNFLRDLLAKSPDRIRWFLASRVVPELGLPRLVVGDQALLIKAQDLRFSKEEMRRLFDNATDLTMSEQELEAVYEGTEGWPAAVQLYRLALSSESVRATLLRSRQCRLQEMAEYLAENVLGQQEPRVQNFLLRTSVLTRLSAPQCHAMFGCSDAEQILTQLERGGLFVRRLDSQEGWFTYHAIFSTFLQEHLRTTQPEAITAAHLAAAGWYEGQSLFEEALHHYVCGEDYPKACEVFSLWSDVLVPDGHFATVDRWAERIPVDEITKHPDLVVKLAWAFAFLSKHSKLAPLLPVLRANATPPTALGDPSVVLGMVSILQDDLARSLADVAHIDPNKEGKKPLSRFQIFELSAVLNARGYAAMSTEDYKAALACLAYGRSLSERSSTTFSLAYSLAKTGISLVSQGELKEAVVHLRASISDPRMYLEESVSKASLACSLIMALYEANELDEAMEVFHRFREIIAGAALHDYLVVCYRAIARIYDSRGQPSNALQVLDEAERIAYAGQWRRAVRLINSERMRRELVMGNLDRSRTIASRIDADGQSESDDWVRFSEDAEGLHICRIRLHIHAGQYVEALELIQPSFRSATRQRRVHRLIKLSQLSALIHQGQGNEKLAHRCLQEALELAAPGGYVRAFLDEGDRLLKLLHVHRAQHSANSVPNDESPVNILLGTLTLEPLPLLDHEFRSASQNTEKTASSQLFHDTPREPLTKKEMRVLLLLTKYMSYEQISTSLFVSRDTVKYHVKNIYAKLGVSSRLEAIRVASTLGL